MRLSVKCATIIRPNVEMIDIGIDSAAMIVERKLPRNSNTTSAARPAPITRCSSTSSADVRICNELSRTTSTE